MAVTTNTGDSAGLTVPATPSSTTTSSVPAPGSPVKTPRAYVIGMPIASAGLWMAVLAPALVVLAIKVSEITTPETRAGALSLVAGVGA
ncbi:hypothetical protein [Arthrobacter nitrophenolicus]|nr:hypothetical protein [Arthrobacter nitrophenolicus]